MEALTHRYRARVRERRCIAFGIHLTTIDPALECPALTGIPHLCGVMKREAGENPAQGRCCDRPEAPAICPGGVSRGKAAGISLRAVSQKTCLSRCRSEP